MQKYEITTDSNSDLPVSYAEKFQTVIIRSIMPLGKRYTVMKNICLRQNFMNA